MSPEEIDLYTMYMWLLITRISKDKDKTSCDWEFERSKVEPNLESKGPDHYISDFIGIGMHIYNILCSVLLMTKIKNVTEF